MESIFSRYKNALVLMLVLLAQVVLLAMQVRRPAPDMPDGHNVRLWRYWVASIVTPPERIAHNIGLGIRGVWTNYIHLRNLREQNQALQDENDRLRLEQASVAQDAREGQQLRELLDFKGRYIDKTVPAQVIGTSGTDQAHVIYIDKGFKDGIRAQMAVITPDGVVGKVKNVFPGTAQVLLISDQTSGAGVMLETTHIRGVLKGGASGQPQIVNISPDDRIKPGEGVLTSGGDQVYPPGLPVGVVDRVVSDPDTSYVNVVIKPNANLAKLEQVLVITEVSDKMPFSQEKDLMQSEVDALAEKQRASDILSEKLPSLRDEDAPEATDAGGSATGDAAAASGGDPARPMRPPQPLHPDRYTPGAAPDAASLTPGAAPAGLNRDLTAPAADSAAAKAAKPTGSGTAAESTTGRGAVPANRFPPKVVPAAPAAQTAATSAGTGSTAATTVARSTGTGSPATGGAVAKPMVKSTAADGFLLPLQPADAYATRRTAAAPGTSADSTAVHVPRPPASAIGSTVGRAPGTVNSTGVAPRSPTTANAVNGSSAAEANVPGRTAAASSGATPTTRRVVIPSSADGILTPAGMGFIGTTPRPRPASAPSTGTATGTSTAASHPAGAAKPPTSKPATNPATRPATSPTPPGGR